MNENLLIAIIERLELETPTLKSKIYPGAADASAIVPYSAYKSKESPIRSKDGIVGYNTIFELAVFEKTLLDAKAIKEKVVEALEGFSEDVWRLSYDGSQDIYYPEYDIHGITLTFKIL